MQEIIKQYGIDAVWHFTDELNLSLIKQHGGVYSLREIERRGIKVPIYGGNQQSHELDKQKGLDCYVHLSFAPYHPMCYAATKEGRIPKPVYLRIDPSILLNDGVRFCAEAANKTGAVLIDPKDAESEIDFEALFTFSPIEEKTPAMQKRLHDAEKGEILIPDFIPVDLILAARYV